MRTFAIPFKTLHSCSGGVNGRGYAKSSFVKHLHDRHFSSAEKKDFCRELITKDLNVYLACEKLLGSLRLWLCGKCMHLHAWSMPCRGREGAVHGEAGPLNRDGAVFLLHGLTKLVGAVPECLAPTIDAVCDASSLDSDALADDDDNYGVVLSTDLLNAIFQRQFTTVKCIPHQCRLGFSRELKFCLDKVMLAQVILTCSYSFYFFLFVH